VAVQPVTRADGHCHWFGRHAEDRDAVRREVERLVVEGADVIKIMITGGMSTPGSRPGVPQYDASEVAAAVETAHRAGVRVAAHVLGSAGVRVAVDAGVDTLEHGWTITGGDQRFEPDVVAPLAASGMIASVTSHEKLRDLLPGALTPTGDLPELRRRLIPHRAVAAAGVPLVVHSDCGPYRTRYDRFGLSIRVFHEGMGVPVERAVAAATSLPAMALGLDHEVGAIAPGRRADLVLLDGDPTTDPDALTRVRRVILGGRVTVEDGRLV
jgi:imidazolonepropionase-like amidohydrolase